MPGCGCAFLLSQQRALADCEQERDVHGRNTNWLVRLQGEPLPGGKGGMSQGCHMDKSGSESNLGARLRRFGAKLEEAEKRTEDKEKAD